MTRHLKSNTNHIVANNHFLKETISLMNSKLKFLKLFDPERYYRKLREIKQNKGIRREFDQKYADRSESAATKKNPPKTNTVIRNLRVIPELDKIIFPPIGELGLLLPFFR